MKNIKTDSTANLSRFARDKRQRTTTTERVERSPRPRREAMSDGFQERRPKATTEGRRASYNPHFTSDNRLRPEYEHTSARPRREERGEHVERTERTARTTRTSRDTRDSRTSRSSGYAGEGRSRTADNNKKRTFAAKCDDKPRTYPKYNPNKQMGEIRLNRFISQSGICSRREADDFILAGVVTVNGQVVTELGTKILPTDEVRFHDEKLQGEKHVYLVLNKPKGYVTSLEDPHADKTVMDLVKGACTERVYPVGRLDKNSLGLLLITNDGDITRQLTHPSYRKKKIYEVTLDKPLTRADMETLTEGITLDDGDIFADEVAYASEDKRTVGVEIHSGRNRIVRRMFEHLGYSVQKLDRVYYAGLTKKNLKRGAWRFLTKDEVMRLKTGQYE